MTRPPSPIPTPAADQAGPCAAAPGPSDRLPALPRETLLALEHQLRNHLNSLLMTAAALSMRCEGQDGLELYDQMERDVRHCLDLVRGLSDTAT